MSRPSARIIETLVDDNNYRWEILSKEKTYVVTYRGEEISIRVHTGEFTISSYVKYKKFAYANLGNVIKEVNYLNNKFKTKDFGYKEI